MKNSPLTTILLAGAGLSALLSVGLCWFTISNTRELRNLQTQANMINNNRAIAGALVNDAIEYGKKNPAIDPILESAGFKPKTATAPAKAH